MRCRVPSRPTVLLAAATVAALALTGCGGSSESGPTATSDTPAAATSSSVAPATSAPASSITPVLTRTPRPSRTTPAPATTTAQAKPKATTRAASTATRLPLDLPTGDAEQAVTVVTSSSGDTTATVQRWSKDGSRWRKVGAAIDGYVGSGGVGRASEGSTRTPAGSYTLTQAFGRDSDPGTRLPYVRTTEDDFWISSPGPDYNTRQRCGDCGYDNGVNEHLREITPEYNYAVVIDYNTRNAPGGVKPGRGSAFFLHVENGEPTAGCVSIPQSRLVTLMQWLRPAAHPRILIGVS